MTLTKMMAPLTQTLGANTAKKRNLQLSIRLLYLLKGIQFHSSWADLKVASCIFTSFNRCSEGFRSGLIQSHLKIVLFLPFHFSFQFGHSWVLLSVCFWLLSCWRIRDLQLRLPATVQCVSLQEASLEFRLHGALHKCMSPSLCPPSTLPF